MGVREVDGVWLWECPFRDARGTELTEKKARAALSRHLASKEH